MQWKRSQITVEATVDSSGNAADLPDRVVEHTGKLGSSTISPGSWCKPDEVDDSIVEFYEEARFEFDVWSEWCGAFKPFGRALAIKAIFKAIESGARRTRRVKDP